MQYIRQLLWKLGRRRIKRFSLTGNARSENGRVPRVLHSPPVHCNIWSYFSGYKFLPAIYVAVRQVTATWLLLQNIVQ